jgi:hypothetical protein
MRYEGRARLGVDGHELVIRVADVEDPNWSALVLDPDGVKPGVGELAVTLVEPGLYAGWCGTAVVSRSRDRRVRLMGHEPLTPPVGA